MTVFNGSLKRRFHPLFVVVCRKANVSVVWQGIFFAKVYGVSTNMFCVLMKKGTKKGCSKLETHEHGGNDENR